MSAYLFKILSVIFLSTFSTKMQAKLCHKNALWIYYFFDAINFINLRSLPIMGLNSVSLTSLFIYVDY